MWDRRRRAGVLLSERRAYVGSPWLRGDPLRANLPTRESSWHAVRRKPYPATPSHLLPPTPQHSPQTATPSRLAAYYATPSAANPTRPHPLV